MTRSIKILRKIKDEYNCIISILKLQDHGTLQSCHGKITFSERYWGKNCIDSKLIAQEFKAHRSQLCNKSFINCEKDIIYVSFTNSFFLKVHSSDIS